MFFQLLQSDGALVAIREHLPLCGTEWTHILGIDLYIHPITVHSAD